MEETYVIKDAWTTLDGELFSLSIKTDPDIGSGRGMPVSDLTFGKRGYRTVILHCLSQGDLLLLKYTIELALEETYGP